LSACASRPDLYLQFYSEKQGRVIKEYKVERGDKFYLDYTHSSEKTPIHDIFQIDENANIVLLEEQYHWYAVGLESNPEYQGATILFDGKITRVLVNRLFPVFLLRAGWVADQSFTLGHEMVKVNDITDGGDLLKISVLPISVFD